MASLGRKTLNNDRGDGREHKYCDEHRHPAQPAEPGGGETVGYPVKDSDGAGHSSLRVQAGTDMPWLFPADFVGDALSGGLGFAEVRQRQRIGFELS